MSDDDDIIKVCEVTLYDDKAEFDQLTLKDPKELGLKLEKLKDKGLKLVEMYASMAKAQAKILMTQAIKINQVFNYSEKENKVTGDAAALLFMIASILKFPVKNERQKLLEINSFMERYEYLNRQLENETQRIQDLVKRADSYNKMDREERREAIMNMFKKINNSKSGDLPQGPLIPDGKRRPASLARGGDEGNEVEKLYKKLKDANLPPEADRIVEQEFKKLRSLDARN
mmetsp:Transcript_31130/g.47581  ORF Transcript_31130/g.47581 Transcript_31130/m.47581 type:complete len:230 (+) Transcript_31130:414-1103(+)